MSGLGRGRGRGRGVFRADDDAAATKPGGGGGGDTVKVCSHVTKFGPSLKLFCIKEYISGLNGYRPCPNLTLCERVLHVVGPCLGPCSGFGNSQCDYTINVI